MRKMHHTTVKELYVYTASLYTSTSFRNYFATNYSDPTYDNPKSGVSDLGPDNLISYRPHVLSPAPCSWNLTSAISGVNPSLSAPDYPVLITIPRVYLCCFGVVRLEIDRQFHVPLEGHWQRHLPLHYRSQRKTVWPEVPQPRITLWYLARDCFIPRFRRICKHNEGDVTTAWLGNYKVSLIAVYSFVVIYDFINLPGLFSSGLSHAIEWFTHAYRSYFFRGEKYASEARDNNDYVYCWVRLVFRRTESRCWG
jgi:hypothetical protein